MNTNVIKAEVIQQAVVSLDLGFVVIVKAPVEMPPKVYNISYQLLMTKMISKEDYPRVIYELLSERVLADYNKFVEDCPILDMFEDPIKYEQCSYVEFTFPPIFGEKSGKLWS